MSVREIRRAVSRRVRIDLPASKSYTQRALVAAALARGESIIRNPSRSTDSGIMIASLREFGVEIADEGSLLRVKGLGGDFPARDRTLDVGNAGTCMRFLTALAALAPGTTVLTGDAAMLRRPVRGLVDALRQAGAEAESSSGFPPVTVRGGTFTGGSVSLNTEASSQFLSALLLVAPYAVRGLEVTSSGRLSSAPYVPMTLHTMERFGVAAERRVSSWRVREGGAYSPCEYRVEADVSAATVFGAAAAVTGCTVAIPGIGRGTLQGDVGFFGILGDMGCPAGWTDDGIEISRRGALHGIRADMNAVPDSVPALAVAAAFAATPTEVTNVAHLRHKETDRLAALADGLEKIGARAEITPGGLIITPGPLRGAEIESYDDHRIAMGFAVAGLAVEGVKILNPECVAKSFPGFWTELEKFN